MVKQENEKLNYNDFETVYIFNLYVIRLKDENN